MAALIRARSSNALMRQLPSIRLVSSTPQKKSDATTTVPTTPQTKDDETIDFSIEAVKKSTKWVSYGYETADKEGDRRTNRGAFFLSVTVCLVFGSFVFSYLPDPKLRDWAQREAFIQIRERELLGLDVFISPDYTPADQVNLPTDEELGDTEIII